MLKLTDKNRTVGLALLRIMPPFELESNICSAFTQMTGIPRQSGPIIMNLLRNLKIKYKLTLIAVTATAAALICVVVAFVLQDLQLVKRVKAEQVESQLSILTGNLAHALAHKDLETVRYLLKNGSSAHGVVASQVYDQGGTVLAKHPLVAGKLTPIPNPEGFDFPLTKLRRPIVWQGSQVGELEVYVSYSDVKMRVVYMSVYSAAAFLLAVVIAAVVGWLVQKIVSDPLLALHKVSQTVIESGNYSERVNVSSNDEIGQLGRAFNRMLGYMEQRDLMLEKQVYQRTRELQKLAEDFRYRALHDALTGLPNRALLNEEFKRAKAHARRSGRGFSVMLLDLDNFKYINDSYGHDVGDELLKAFANRIRSALRAEDTVCRLGGDEFIILLEGVDNAEHIHSVAQNLLQAMSGELSVSGRLVRIGTSIGASIYPQHGEDITILKRSADIAMYCAKEAGKNQLMVYEKELASINRNRLMMHNDLHHAIERRELELYFQPQVNIVEESVVGCEVLVRWQHPAFGFMEPSEFIPFAEESGAIRELDYFVLREACRQAQRWRHEFGLVMPVSVNIAAQHFQSNLLVEQVKTILRETELPANMLTLEFGESALLLEASAASRALKELGALGVRLALSGFGEGFCSLVHVQNINLHQIKLDRVLCRGIQRNQGERKVIRALLAFAEQMEVDLVAEGIEEQVQIDILRDLGCKIAQGFVFAKPAGQGAFLNWTRLQSARSEQPSESF